MREKIVSIVVGMSMIGGSAILPIAVFAENSPSQGKANKELIESLKRQIDELEVKKDELKAKEKELREAAKEVKSEIKETRKLLSLQLRRGMSGEEVEALQEILSQDSSIYPEGLITGFFGPLTENAVRKFQRKYGIDSIGQVGPLTRVRLNALLEEWQSAGRSLPAGLLKKLGRLGTTTIATTTATSTRAQGEFKVTLCHKPGYANETITVAIPALVAHIAHGDRMGECSGLPTPPTPTTTPDIIPPVISGVTATSVASTSAHITWATNEAADSKVWFATSTPVATSTATPAINASLVSAHDLLLSTLSASTTYYYKVSSKDSAGNEAISSESSFSTLP